MSDGASKALSMAQVLLVGDSPADVQLAQTAMRENGLLHCLRLAHDAAHALRMLKREGDYAHTPRPDLILLDMQLPGGQAVGLLRVLKNDAELRSIPVLAISPGAEEGEAAGAEFVGCTVAKPTQIADIFRLAHALRDSWLPVIAAWRGHA